MDVKSGETSPDEGEKAEEVFGFVHVCVHVRNRNGGEHKRQRVIDRQERDAIRKNTRVGRTMHFLALYIARHSSVICPRRLITECLL